MSKKQKYYKSIVTLIQQEGGVVHSFSNSSKHIKVKVRFSNSTIINNLIFATTSGRSYNNKQLITFIKRMKARILLSNANILANRNVS